MSSIESTYKEFQNHAVMFNNKNRASNEILTFEDALERTQEAIMEDLELMKDEGVNEEDKDRPKKKSDLRREKERYHEIIRNAVYRHSFSVLGYDGESGLDNFIDDVVEEIVGHSVLSKAFSDPLVDDIFCIAWDTIYVEREGVNELYVEENEWVPKTDYEGNIIYKKNKHFEIEVDENGDPVPVMVQKPITFRNPNHYRRFIERVLALTGKQVDYGEHKIVDAEFYEDRIAVTGKSVTPNDFSMTIRKHKESHILLEQIVQSGVMSEEIADMLGTIIIGESNLIYAGITGSGKTTTLRALLDFYVAQSNKRMLVAEDTQELFPGNPHTVEMVTSKTNDDKTNVDLRDLIMTSLRLKPKYIVVGEVRGKEAEAAVEAMETGHSTLFTMHGGTGWNIVNRLVNKYLMQMPSLSTDVVERIIGSSVDYVVVQDAIPGIGRRITSITELFYDFKKKRLNLIPIIQFDFDTEDFVQINKLAPSKADKMMRRGISKEDLDYLIRDDDDNYVGSLQEYKRLMSESSYNESEGALIVSTDDTDDDDDMF